MVKLLQKDYGYTLNSELFSYEDLVGGHDERAWTYRFNLLLKQYYQF